VPELVVAYQCTSSGSLRVVNPRISEMSTESGHLQDADCLDNLVWLRASYLVCEFDSWILISYTNFNSVWCYYDPIRRCTQVMVVLFVSWIFGGDDTGPVGRVSILGGVVAMSVLWLPASGVHIVAHTSLR
jgi:hypothetical protein